MSTGKLVGKQIGNYVVQEVVGRGGMGEVYLAEHPRIGRKVAIKVLAPYIAAHPRAAERFEAEARVISHIDHPNIVNLFDYGNLEDGSLYYVMELLQGQELDKVITSRERMSADDVYPYLVQICRGLQAAHDKGVVHRDLKPQNIFVLEGNELRVKILDFGIAKLLETDQEGGLTTTGMVMGTPLFISPEQAAGQSQSIGPHSDIYSLGVILFRMLSGRHPFEGKVASLLLASHIQTMPPLLREVVPAVPEEVASVVHRCLEKHPARRPTSAAQIATLFARAIGQPVDPSLEMCAATLPPELAQTEMSPTGPQSLTTLQGTAGEVVPRRPGRARLGVALVAAAAAAVGVGVVFMLRPSPSPSPPPVRAPSPPSAHHTVRIVTGVAAICELKQGSEAQKMTSPCRFRVEGGRQASLTVSSGELHPFLKQWTVDEDLDLTLAVDRRSQRLALAEDLPRAASSAPDAAPAAAPDSRPARAARPRRRDRRPKPAEVKEAAPKKEPRPKQEHIGEGTMEVDL